MRSTSVLQRGQLQRAGLRYECGGLLVAQRSWLPLCWMSLLALMFAGYASMPIRKKLFTKAFYEKNFPELLKQGRLPEAG